MQKSSAVFLLLTEGIASGKWEGDVAHCFPYIYMCLYVLVVDVDSGLPLIAGRLFVGV